MNHFQLAPRPPSYTTSISPTLVSKNRSSGVSTLCERDIFYIDPSSKLTSSVDYDSSHKQNRYRKPISSCPFPSGFFKKITVLILDYKTKRRLRKIGSQFERLKSFYHPTSNKELESIYKSLRGLKHFGRKSAYTALILRLSVLEFLLDFNIPPVLFSEQRKHFLTKLWADLVYEESSVPKRDLNIETQRQIIELKQRVFSRVLDELPLNSSICEIIPDGDLFVETLCEELAYGSAAYAVQRALKQIARMEWGHEELLRLSTPHDQKQKSGNLIMDCIIRLLRFQNGFSCTMAFQIFGRLSMSNSEVYTLLEGPMGVGWLVETLYQVYYREDNRVRVIETYCRALVVACAQGFIESILKKGIVSVLLRLIQRFNDRDKRTRGKIEDELEDDLDVERDQIAYCGSIIILMKDPSGKKELEFLDRSGDLTTFMDNSNRAFSDWKLLANIASIQRLRKSNRREAPVKEPLVWNYL